MSLRIALSVGLVLGGWCLWPEVACGQTRPATRPAEGRRAVRDRPPTSDREPRDLRDLDDRMDDWDTPDEARTKEGARLRRGGWRDRRESPGGAGPRSPEGRPQGPRPFGPPHEDLYDGLTAQEREDLLAFAKEHFPEVYERLDRLQQEDRSAFRAMIRRAGWPMLRLLRLHKHDPELAARLIAEHKIEMELGELRRDYIEFGSESARERIKARVRELMEQRFTLRQERLKLEIAGLERRLEGAKEQLAKQEANRRPLVDADVERFTDQLEEEGMWGQPPPPPPGDDDPDALPRRPDRPGHGPPTNPPSGEREP